MLRMFLKRLNQQIVPREHMDWFNQVDQWREEHPALEIRECDALLPQYVIRQIYEVTKGDATIVTGVGQNQMWAAQFFFYDKPNCLVSSGGLGTMGFELPGAIGAKVGRPDETVWCIAGDGGFQMTIQELATIVQENLAVKIAIINNGYLGMVRQWQELFYKRRYVDTPALLVQISLRLLKLMASRRLRVKDKLDVIPAIEKAMDHQGPFLIDFVVEPEENVFPIVPPGAALVQAIEMPSQRR